MAITDPDPPSVTYRGKRYAFCSRACQARFADKPERFVAVSQPVV